MRKIVLFMMTSLDGYFEGLNHELDWHNVDSEFNKFAVGQLQQADCLIFGHRTYDLMASYWPSAKADDTDDAEVARIMNDYPKIVFSSFLVKADWTNTEVETNIEKLKNLRNQAGKDLLVLGSNNLSVSLLEARLLDEVRVMINPVVIGAGHTLFTGTKQKLNFNLLNTREFKSGNVLLTLKPDYL